MKLGCCSWRDVLCCQASSWFAVTPHCHMPRLTHSNSSFRSLTLLRYYCYCYYYLYWTINNRKYRVFKTFILDIIWGVCICIGFIYTILYYADVHVREWMSNTFVHVQITRSTPARRGLWFTLDYSYAYKFAMPYHSAFEYVLYLSAAYLKTLKNALF